MQATIEELETSNEELQASNEELLASNEELQSTNEELQSLNEELQSVNEELHTVNAENQSKIIELIELNNDLDNLIASTRIGTLFLDENLTIRRFTPEVKRIFKILDGDVGHPISRFAHKLVGIDPAEVIRAVVASAVVQEREVCTQEGAWFHMRVLPYHVGMDTVSGVVLTFTDVGLLKTTREALLDSETRLSSLYRTVPVGVGRVANRVFLEINDYLCQMVGYAREELLDQRTRILYLSQEEFESAGKHLYEHPKQEGVGARVSRWRSKDGMH